MRSTDYPKRRARKRTRLKEQMQEYISEIPLCPESISTADVREYWMDACQDLISRGKLTPTALETLKACCFSIEVGNIAEKNMIGKGGEIDTVMASLWSKCTDHLLECSELLGLTPKDRGLLL